MKRPEIVSLGNSKPYRIGQIDFEYVPSADQDIQTGHNVYYEGPDGAASGIIESLAPTSTGTIVGVAGVYL